MLFIRRKMISGRSLLFAGTVLACTAFAPASAYAGFEWSPPTQNPAEVPVVTPKRQAVIPAPTQEVQRVPTVMPPRLPALSAEATGKDPNTRVHTMRRMEDAAKRAEESRQSILRVIEKNPDYKQPAPVRTAPAQPAFKRPAPTPVEPVGALPPLPMDLTPTSSQRDPVSSGFTPMPYQPAPVQAQRKTNASAPLPIVRDAMRDVEKNYKASRSSVYEPHNRIAVPDIPDPVPVAPSYTPAASVPPASGSIVINPYPTKTSALATSDRQPQARVVPVAAPVSRSQPTSSYEIASGFGNDIPLIMALQQIVPAQYTYSFHSSVNPGQRVSWEGGQGWDLVVLDMLRPLGLTARVHGNAMVIKPAS